MNGQYFHTVFLSLGSNLGNKLLLLQSAKELLSTKAGKINNQSSIYETEPWGFESEQHFLNQVIELQTLLDPIALLETCLSIELELGRIRNNENGYHSRTMDIDVLFFDSQILNFPNLKIPHPLLQKRLFVLDPLVEIAPNFIHPVLQKTITELRNNFME